VNQNRAEPQRVRSESERSRRALTRPGRKSAWWRFWPRSLTFRVIAFSTIWAVLALIVIFTLINTLYRQASERGFDSLLSAHLFNLIGSVGNLRNRAPDGFAGSRGSAFLRAEFGLVLVGRAGIARCQRGTPFSFDDTADPVAHRGGSAIQFGVPAQLHH
jgi:hypothetical protein